MKLINQTVTSRLTILLLFVLTIGGCALTGMERAEDTRTTMETMENDIKMATQQLEATNASLNNLMRPGQTDVQQAFNSYSENVSKMEEMENKFAKHSEEMKAQGKEYFSEWKKEGKEYTNPEIQQLSNERRSELEETYSKISENSIGVSEAFKTYVSNISEIQTYLSTDLTTKGITAISPISKKVISSGSKLKSAIQDVQTAIRDAQAEMAIDGTN
jgi:hypoxanthine phosphoribosyltransferase